MIKIHFYIIICSILICTSKQKTELGLCLSFSRCWHRALKYLSEIVAVTVGACNGLEAEVRSFVWVVLLIRHSNPGRYGYQFYYSCSRFTDWVWILRGIASCVHGNEAGKCWLRLHSQASLPSKPLHRTTLCPPRATHSLTALDSVGLSQERWVE